MQSLVGTYNFGAVRSIQHRLDLLKNHRFTYLADGCRGVCARASGTWEQKNDVLLLTPKLPYDPVKARLNLRLIPVSWGKRFYLIDENELPGFCAAVHQKVGDVRDRYISMRDFALRFEREPLPRVYGLPTVPFAYREFLTQGEIKATVSAVTASYEILLQESVPGRLKPGMRLCLCNYGNAPNVIVVSCDHAGVHVKPLPSYYRRTAIQKGDRYTTGSYRFRPEGTGLFSTQGQM